MKSVRSGIRTHAHKCGPEYSFAGKSLHTLESGALDRSAILTHGIFAAVCKYWGAVIQ